jgi:hypothetical protein
MPHWEGIEDSSAVPAAVWLSRPTNKENTFLDQDWKPLRKIDCKALNENEWKRQDEIQKHEQELDDVAAAIASTKSSYNSIRSRSKDEYDDDNDKTTQTAETTSSSFAADTIDLGYSTSSKKWCVNIEGGRSKADPVTNRIYYNFVRGIEREMLPAVWFLTKDTKSSSSSSGGEKSLRPIPVTSPNSNMIELLYQRAVSSMSSLGNGIDSVLKDDVQLEDDDSGDFENNDFQSKAVIHKSGDTLTMRIVRVPKKGSWIFGSSTSSGNIGSSSSSSWTMLQRGYGHYDVVGEENENLLGPVKHLVFIIHGIGEAWFSRDDVSISGIVDNVDATRLSIQKKQIETWKKKQSSLSAAAASSSSTSSFFQKNAAGNTNQQQKQKQETEESKVPIPPPDRIEFIPIEWYSRIHDSSNSLMKSLQRTTLSTIPALRSIANDVVFDILMVSQI